MLTLRDLSEYDIKNIDFAKFISQLFHRKDILANIAVIFISFFIITKILNQRNLSRIDIELEISNLEKKAIVVSEYESAKKDTEDFFKSLPQGLRNADHLIDKANEMAIINNIQISSFSPSGKIKANHYEGIKMKFKISADTYNDIVSFIYELEDSQYNIRVENWSTSSEPYERRRRRDTPDASKQRIAADLEIASIVFKKWE